MLHSRFIIVVTFLALLVACGPSSAQVAQPMVAQTATIDQVIVAGMATGIAATEIARPTNTPTPEPTTTRRPRDPLDQGLRVDACGNDLCIFPHAGGSISLGLGSTYTRFFGASWSPDGSRIVLAACPIAELTNDKCQELFIAGRDGKKVTPLARNPSGHSLFTPVWSPDGEWIAYQDDGTLGIIRLDGTGKRRVLPFLTTLGITPDMWLPIAWSPDSKQIAMLMSVRHNDTLIMDPPERVWVVNRDGSGQVRTILNSDVPIGNFAWSPDGQSIVVALEDGKAYGIDAKCDNKPAGCDASSRTKIDSVPEHWLSNFYPQWVGETTSPTPNP
jgi:WD40 repeat protein